MNSSRYLMFFVVFNSKVPTLQFKTFVNIVYSAQNAESFVYNYRLYVMD